MAGFRSGARSISPASRPACVKRGYRNDKEQFCRGSIAQRVVRMNRAAPNTRLKGAYRLADRRWRDAQFGGRFAKAAVLGDAHESLHAVERAVPDCEVLLHTSSILSRIVAPKKWWYI